MIDLSFLTEEEQEAIMKVLHRDAELKKAEEERVKVLEDTVEDTNELKNKTGQWFYDAKSKRHRDKIHGADLIRASIKKKKPQTIAELSQSRIDKTKKSWVNNVNKDLFVPPELFGVMEEPDREDEEEKTQGQLYRSAPKVDNLYFNESQQSTLKAVSSPSKQRKNPFNDHSLEDDFELNTENQILENGSARSYELAEKDLIPSSQRSEYSKKTPKIEPNENSQNFSDDPDGPEKKTEHRIPKPKVRTVTYKIADAQSDSDSSFSKPARRNDSLNGTGARKGILKRSPSSSSTDSEILRISHNLDSQSKTLSPNLPILEGEADQNYIGNPPDQSSQNSIDRLKQVRFTSVDVPDALPQTPDTHKGREIGEFDLLESDYAKNTKDDIDGVKPLYKDHESFQNSILAHPETVELDSDVAATASDEEDGDVTVGAPSELSSKFNINLKTEAPGLEQLSPTSLLITQPLPSSSELLHEKSSLVDAASVTTPNDIFVNIRENEKSTSGTSSYRESTDLSNLESQTSTLSIDQQPVYATINTPRLSKLDSSGNQQGKESIDESEPSSRKTETMVMENTQPKNDDKRDHFNVQPNANLLKLNTDVQESKDETFSTSKHFSGKFESAATIALPGVTQSLDGPKLETHIFQEWQIEATEPHEEKVFVGKSAVGGGARSDKTTDYLLNRKEQKSTLDIRSKAKVNNVYSDKEILKGPQKDDGNAKSYKNRNLDDVEYPVSLIKENPHSFNETSSVDVSIPHKPAAKGQYNIVEVAGKDIVEIVNKTEVPPNSNISEFNIALVKLQNEANASFNLNHNASAKVSSEDVYNADQKANSQPEFQNSCDSTSLGDEDKELFTEEVDSLKNSTSFQAKEEIKQSMKCPEAETAPREVAEIINRTVAPPNTTPDEFDRKLERLHNEESELHPPYQMHKGVIQKHISTGVKLNATGCSEEPTEKTWPPTKEADALNSELAREDEGSTSPLPSENQRQQSHPESLNHEVKEVILKTVAPPKSDPDEFKLRLKKLCMETNVPLNAAQQTVSEVIKLEEKYDTEHPNIPKSPRTEIVYKRVAKQNAELGEIKRQQEELPVQLKSPTHNQSLGEQGNFKYPEDKLDDQEVKEVISRTCVPQSDISQFHNGLKKLSIEASESSFPVDPKPSEVVRMTIKQSEEFQTPPPTETVEKSVTQSKVELGESKPDVAEVLRRSQQYPRKPKAKMVTSIREVKGHSTEGREVGSQFIGLPKGDIDDFKCGSEKIQKPVVEGSFPLFQKSTQNIEEKMFSPHKHTLGQSMGEEIMFMGETSLAPKAFCSEGPTEHLKLLAHASSPDDSFEQATIKVEEGIVKMVPSKADPSEENSLRNLANEASPASSSVHLEVQMPVKFQEKDSTKQIQSVFQFPKVEAVETSIEPPKSELVQFKLKEQKPSESPRKNSVLIIKRTDAQPIFERGESNTSVNKLLKESSPLQDKMFREKRSISPRQEELLQEVREFIVKAAVPTKTDLSEFKNGLRKLQKEASKPLQESTNDIPKVTSPLQKGNEIVESVSPKPVTELNANVNKQMEVSTQSCDNTLQEQSSVRKPKGEEQPKEVREIILKTTVSTKAELHDFKIGLQKLCQEASEPVLPELPKSLGVIRSQEYLVQEQQHHIKDSKKDIAGKMDGSRITNSNSPLHHTLSLEEVAPTQLDEEVQEVIVKSVSPATDVSSFNTALNQIYEEASLSFQETQEGNVQKKQQEDYSQKQADAVESTTPSPNSDLVAFKVGLEKLHRDAVVSTSLVHKESDDMVNSQENNSECPGKEMMSIMGKTDACPNIDCSEYKISVIKLPKKTASLLRNTQLEQQESINHHEADESSQEISEYVIKSSLSPNNNLSEFKISLMKLQQEASQSLVPELQKSPVVSRSENLDSAQEQEGFIEVPKEEAVGTTEKPALQQSAEHSGMLTVPQAPLFPTLLVQQSAPEHPKEKIVLQEVKEVVVKTVKTEPNVHDFNTALKKLFTADEDLSPVQQEGSVHAKIQEKLSTPQKESPLTFQTEEIMERRTALPQQQVLEFRNKLEKLQREALMFTSFGHEEAHKDLSAEEQNHRDYPNKDVLEVVEKTIIPPKMEHSELDSSLKNLPSLNQNTKKEHSSFKSPNEEVFPQEVTEVILKTDVPPKSSLNEYKIALQKLQKEALVSLHSVHEKTIAMNRSHENNFIEEENNLLECMNEEVAKHAGRMAATAPAGDYKLNASPHCQLSAQGNYLECTGGKELLPEVKKVVRTTFISSKTDIRDCNSDVKKVTAEASQSFSTYHRQPSKPDVMHKDFNLQKQSGLKNTKVETTEMTCAPTKPELEQNSTLLLVSPKHTEFAQQAQFSCAELPTKEISTVEKLDAQPIIESSELNPSVTRQPNELSTLLHHKSLEDQRSLKLSKEELIPQEVSEVIVKTVAPTKSYSNEYKMGLQKLKNEASGPQLPVIVVRMQGKDSSQEPLSLTGHSKESIMIESAAIPPAVDPNGLHTRLNSQLQPKVPLQESPQENVHIQEVKEVIVKSISPKNDLGDFHKGLQKLLTEASLSSPVLQVTGGQTKIEEGFTKKGFIEFPVEESVERKLAPIKTPLVEFKAALEKLQIEALSSTSTGDQSTDKVIKIQKHSTIEKNHLEYPRKHIAEKDSSPMDPKALEEQMSFKLHEDKEPLHEVREVIVKTTAPSKHVGNNFKDILQKLHKEVPDPSLPMLKKTSIVFSKGKDSTQKPLVRDKLQKKEAVDTVNMAYALSAGKLSEVTSAHIVSLSSHFVPGTTGFKDSFLSEPDHISNKMENSEVSSNKSIKKDTVLLKEVRENVEKTTVPSKDLYKFINGLHKLLKESSSPLPPTTPEQQSPLQSSKQGSSSELVKEYTLRSLKPPRAGLSKYGSWMEKLDMNASATSSPTNLESNNVVRIQQMLSTQKSFPKLKQHRATSCTNSESDVSHKAQSETVQKTTELPKRALSTFKAEINTVNKEASPSSPVLHKDIDPFKHNQKVNRSGVYAGQVSEKIHKRVKVPTGDSKQDIGNAQSLQRKLSVKVIQLQHQDVGDHLKEFPPPEVITSDETIVIPKTEKSAFHIGFEKVYNEFSQASTKLVQPADRGNIGQIVPDVQQERVDDQIEIPTVLATKEIKVDHQASRPQETQLPQKVIKAVILPKTEASAFQDVHKKHGPKPSETLLTFDKQTKNLNLENTSGRMSVQDQEKTDCTVNLGDINNSSEKRVMLHSGRSDTTKENTQLLQSSSSVKQKYSDGLEGPRLLRYATDSTVTVSTAEQGTFPIGFENLQGVNSETMLKLNRAPHSTTDHYQNISKDQERLCKTIYLDQPSSTYQTLTRIPIREKKQCEGKPLSVPRRLSTKKIQLAHKVSTGYQLETFLPQEIVKTNNETLVGPKTELGPFNINCKTVSVDNVIEPPTSNKFSHDKEEKSQSTQTKLSTTRIQLHHNVSLQQQQEKYEVRAALDTLETPVSPNLDNSTYSANDQKVQRGTKQYSRPYTILHTPVSLSEKSKLSNNQVVLSFSHPCSTGPSEDQLSKGGNQQRNCENVGHHTPVSELEMARLNQKVEFLHSRARSGLPSPTLTIQSAEIHCEGTALSEDTKAGSEKKSHAENLLELRSSSFRRRATIEKDQKPIVKSSSVALQLSYPYGKDETSRKFVSNIPKGNVKSDTKS